MTLARKKNIPYLVRPIGQLEAWSLAQSKIRKQCYLNLIEKENIVNASAIHFTAETEKKQSLAALNQPIKNNVIPLGINRSKDIARAQSKMTERWSLKSKTITLLFLSRLHPKKGLELLLKALTYMKQQHVQLIIAGEGDAQYTQSLIGLCQSLQLSEQCHFVGHVDGYDKQLLLQGSDLFVLPSHSENFGIATLEALASATPVLISDQVALSKEVKEHNLGWVFKLNEADLKQSLKLALDNQAQYKQLGENAKAYTRDNFNWSKQATKLIGLYQEVIC